MHLFATRLKCLLRNRALLFWTLLFPIILATFFNLAFQNITQGEAFATINVGVVESDLLDENLRGILEGAQNGEKKLFNVTYGTLDQMSSLLDTNHITGFIEITSLNGAPQINLTIKGADINETILKTFLDEYVQSAATFQSIIEIKGFGNVDMDQLMADIASTKKYLSEKDNGTSTPNLMLIYFYSLIGMALIYGGVWGTNEIINLQANLSTKGLRVSISPTKRLKLLIFNMSCAFLIHFSEILILLAYITFVIGVTFGHNLPLIILVCVLGSFTGISFGAFIGISLKRASEGLKIGLTSIVGVFGGFLSGMMYANVKYWVETNIPLLAYINPVNVMTDSLYSLYYFPTKERFFIDIGILSAMIVVFTLGTYLNFRRDDYESL